MNMLIHEPRHFKDIGLMSRHLLVRKNAVNRWNELLIEEKYFDYDGTHRLSVENNYWSMEGNDLPEISWEWSWRRFAKYGR